MTCYDCLCFTTIIVIEVCTVIGSRIVYGLCGRVDKLFLLIFVVVIKAIILVLLTLRLLRSIGTLTVLGVDEQVEGIVVELEVLAVFR